MASVSVLIKGFRANVREGNPCTLTFDGKGVQLYPIESEAIIPAWKDAIRNRTHVGLVIKASRLPRSPVYHIRSYLGFPRIR